ncbi:MAG: tetratricopeptide repeat protein [Wenzhouxiangella sp.]|jgi:tetratricopeptide (TPR) repeat protein|nr:tetratricopeptide repeat protein [Wenzhouxiangella sp.]
MNRLSALRCGFLLLAIGIGMAGPVQAQGTASDAEAVDRLALAALLIGDGNFERARTVLAGVELDDEGLDLMRFHSLEGLVALNLEELPRAAAAFEKVAEAALQQGEPVAEVIWLYLAQSYFGQKDYAGVLGALDRAATETTELPSVYLMRAQSHWELGQTDSAWQVLASGVERFPDRAGEFTRRQVFWLVDLGLYQQAAETGLAFLDRHRAATEDAVAIGNALRQAGQYDEALRVLEVARLNDPDDIQLTRVLAHTWLAREQILPAADLIHAAGRRDPQLVIEAAELYRRSGWLIKALMLNGQVIDQPKKFRQRLAILLELERFDQAAAMEETLFRTGLLDDEEIRYALAFAYFKTGEYDQAERHLAGLSSDDLFRKAIELRRAMEQCAAEPWLCG